MTKVARMLREQPRQTALFPFIADAPTTTFQRLKALVTGTVPAFIEAGENFGASELAEDNLLDQLLAQGRNATLLGDETWLQILPGRFHRHFDAPSFDIRDLDTVDNTVIAHIFEELARPDWALLVAHCLGVDHAGHRYGPAHPEMGRKLRQMDRLIAQLARRMAEDTLLLVIGDHGMTASGDHGGDTEQELASALFAYTKRRPDGGTFWAAGDEQCQQNCSNGKKGQKTLQNVGKAVQQVDLVPTLALLLDLPIPYSNIGRLIGPLFPSESANAATHLQHEMRLNALQMLRYGHEYAKQQPQLRDQLRHIVRRHESSPDDVATSRETIGALQRLIRHSLEAQFQWTVAALGLLSLLDAILFNCFLLKRAMEREGEEEGLSPCLWVFRSALLLLQLSLVFARQPAADQVLFCLASLVVSLCYQLPVLLADLFRPIRARIEPSLVAVLSAHLLLCLLPFSNSFIIYEADVLRFALQSLLLWVTFRIAHAHRICPHLLRVPHELGDTFSSSFSVLIFLRVFKQFETCREEQVGCLRSEHSQGQLFLLCIVVTFGSVYFLTEQCWFASPMTRALVWPSALLLTIHWLFELTVQAMQARVPSAVELEQSKSSALATIAWLELSSRTIALAIFCLASLHQLLQLLLWPLNDDATNGTARVDRVQAQFQALCLPLMALNGPVHGWRVGLTVAMFPVGEQLFRHEKLWTWVWFLHMLGAFSFYASGHQATLSAIPWRAAFVALPGNFPWQWVPGTFILLAMFWGRMLAALMAQMGEERSPERNSNRAQLFLLLFGGLKVLGCASASLLHHRHLMFYKVFAPKFVFDAVEHLCCCAFVLGWACLLEIGRAKPQQLPHNNGDMAMATFRRKEQ